MRALVILAVFTGVTLARASEVTRVDGVPVYGRVNDVERVDIQEAIKAGASHGTVFKIDVLGKASIIVSLRNIGFISLERDASIHSDGTRSHDWSSRPYVGLSNGGRGVTRTLFNPKPDYPESLRKRGIGGQGEFLMHVDHVTGKVTSVDVTKSTGVSALDESCIRAFREWQFVPNSAAPIIHCPIKFSAKTPSNQ